MPTGMDHPIIACLDPDSAADELEHRLGLRAAGGGRHDEHGTYNRLIWLGDAYLELMGVFDERLAAQSWWGAHVLGVLAQGAGYAGVALGSEDLAADVARLRGLGSPVSDPIDGRRVRPDGDVVRWRIGRLPAPDAEMGLVFLIEHDTGAAEWRPEERAARAAFEHPLGGTAGLRRLELPVADVARTSLRLLRELGLQFRPSLAGGGARDTTLGTQTLRLIPARLAPRPTIVIRGGTAPSDVEMLGVRWQMVPEKG